MNHEHAYTDLSARLKRKEQTQTEDLQRLNRFEQDLNRICTNALNNLKPEVAELLPLQWTGLIKRMNRQFNLLVLSLFLWIATLFYGLYLHYQWRDELRRLAPSEHHLELMLDGQKYRDLGGGS